MQKLKEAKVGDTVNVFCMLDGGGEFRIRINKTPNTISISARVLQQKAGEEGNGTVLGWIRGEPHPGSLALADTNIELAWAKAGFIFVQTYGDHCECEILFSPPAKKNYGNECPCGIHPSKCDYHGP